MKGLFDSNIFLSTDDSSTPDKKRRAVGLIAEFQRAGKAVVSLQVLQGYCAAATRKLGVAPELAQQKAEIISRMLVVRFDASDVISSIELHRVHKISSGMQ